MIRILDAGRCSSDIRNAFTSRLAASAKALSTTSDPNDDSNAGLKVPTNRLQFRTSELAPATRPAPQAVQSAGTSGTPGLIQSSPRLGNKPHVVTKPEAAKAAGSEAASARATAPGESSIGDHASADQQAMFEITISGKDGQVFKRVELAGERPVRIGRSPECEIQIPLASVSREHAQIEPVDERHWVIRDLNSTHGCLVRGQRIRELTITPGLVVEVGPAVLKFEETATRVGAEMLKALKDVDEDKPVRVRGTLLPDETMR